jgi:2-polyprenyl-3-methyl-5-hydroxy-6-metoxy-1,4-benzoquinol methylase
MSSLKSACPACGAPRSEWLFEKDGFDLVRCTDCGLVRVDNPPSSEALTKLYSFETGYHHDLVTDAAVQAIHAAEAQDNLQRLHQFRRSGALLDVGCSTGLFMHAAAKAGWRVKGIEYSADAANQARRHFGPNVVTGVLDNEIFSGEQFDVVTLWDVLEHVPEPLQTLKNARRLLKQDGLLFIKTPNVDGWFPRASLTLAKRLGFWRHPEPPGHLFQFSEKTLGSMLKTAGYEPLSTLHGRIPITYSFGQPREWFRSVKWLAYCSVFVPLAFLGPHFRAGDDMTVVCRGAGERKVPAA